MRFVRKPDPNLPREQCVSVAPGVRRIVAGNAGMMTGPGTNTYLIGSREVAVLDPGPDDARHLDAIVAAAGAAIRWIIVTHTHPDHSPLAQPLARRTGARLIGLPPPGDGRQDPTFAPQHLPADGECLSVGEQRLDCNPYARTCLQLRVLPVAAASGCCSPAIMCSRGCRR